MRATNRWVVGMSAIVLAVGLTTARAQQRPPAPPLASGGPGEGIVVHGYWRIDVRNPDGALAVHREVENALADEAAPHLVNALVGAEVFPAIGIGLAMSGTSTCAVVTGGLDSHCIVPTTVLQTSPFGAVVLNGSTTVIHTGTVFRVDTIPVLACGSGPVPCNPDGLLAPHRRLTTFDLEATSSGPISVVSGQVIQVSVTLSFS